MRPFATALAGVVTWALASSLSTVALAQPKPEKTEKSTGKAPAEKAPAKPAAKPKPAPAKGDAPRGEKGETPAKDAPRPPARALTAIQTVARDLAAALPESIPMPALVVSAPLAADVPVTRANDLARTVSSLIAGQRGFAAAPEPAAFEAARTASRNHRALVYVRPLVEQGKLRVTADVVATPANVWARIRDAAPQPSAHAFAEAPIDAEVRSHLAPIPLTALAPVRGKSFESGIVALACDDLDGDGAPEIVSVSRTRVVLLRIREGKVVPVRARTWTDLSDVAPAPLREPIAFAVTVPSAASQGASEGAARRDVVVSITDRRESLRLDPKLEVVERYVQLAIPDGESIACGGLIGLLVTGAIGACGDGTTPHQATVGGRYDAFASALLVRPDGHVDRVWAGREDRVLELRDGSSHAARVTGVGAQIALGDLDQDGAIEVLTSLDVMDPLADAVVVRSWSGTGAPRELFRMPAGSGVQALATCPPESSGRQAFVVATGDEIAVVR
jgi:hypothetical protein